ncbi:MAG: hypothetical protein HY819_19115 [Acidobacteria bacterium]|nr:hypothetical protein [Acidobacteriota bacterium]
MFQENTHYKAILDFYKDKKATRSKIPYINHINEGLIILDEIQASSCAKEGFCLHPIVQTDEDLAKAFQKDSVLCRYNVDLYSLSLAMEYRWIANGYLSTRTISSLSEVKLSPLEDVQQMLIADKVQNRKDFEIYHKSTHPRAKELEIYFDNWLEILGISQEKYQSLVSIINEKNLLTLAKTSF